VPDIGIRPEVVPLRRFAYTQDLGVRHAEHTRGSKIGHRLFIKRPLYSRAGVGFVARRARVCSLASIIDALLSPDQFTIVDAYCFSPSRGLHSHEYGYELTSPLANP